MVHATLLLAYSKQPCICFKISMYYTYYMTLSFQCDYVIVTSSCDMWPMCDITLILTLSSQNKGKENRDEKEKEKEK